MAVYVCPIEGPFDTSGEAATARTRIARMPEYYSVACFRGREKPKLDLERDKYYVCGFRKEPLYPPPAPPVVPAKKEDFIRDMDLVYECEGESPLLNRYCEEENVEATLRVDLRAVKEIEGPFDVRPPDRTYESVITSWKMYEEVVRRLHEPTKKWYWVTYPAVLSWKPKVKPPTPLKKAWLDYFKNPDIIKAIGLIPSAVQESFSRVFSGYSIIGEEPAEPRPGDYAGVGLILGGIVLATAPVAYAGISAIPGVGTAGMMKGSLGALEAALESTVVKPTLMAKIMGWATKPKTLVKLLGSAIGLMGLDTFIDFIGEEAIQTAGMGVWVLISAKNWEGAKIALDKYRLFIDHLKAKVDLVGPLNLIAYRAFKDTYESAYATADAYEKAINEGLGVLPVEFPEIIKATVRDIIDGDTLDVDLDAYNKETGEAYKLPEYKTTGHARIRMLGINAPEKSPKGEIACSDVEIYKVEKRWADVSRERLYPLNDKEVILKVDPSNQMDSHGRILALVEFGMENINLRQIKEGLACGYYREENKYVDKDLYGKETLAAKEAGIGMWEGVAVMEKFGVDFSINIDSMPSNAKLHIDDVYTHHLTPSDEKELADVMDLLVPGEHVFKATKAGKEASTKVTIVKGKNPDIMLTLKPVGLKVEVPEEVPAPPEEVPEEFSIYIDSTPTRAKLYIDGVYTHHFTPSDTAELSDVMDLLTPGKHTIKVTKAGKAASKEVEILPGFNEPIHLTLRVVGLPPVEVPPKVVGIPSIEGLTEEQLRELRDKINVTLGE